MIIDKETLYKLYIEEKKSTPEIAVLYNCTARTIQNYLKKYEIQIRSFSEASKISSKNRTENVLRERAMKCRATWYARPKEERERINRTRATKPENIKDAVNKARITKMKNQSTTKSKAEDSFYNQLLISFPDTIRQYYDEVRYPYNCDFYVPSKDLFLEYQGHYTHGHEPFDAFNVEHLKILSNTKVDMTTWVKRDPQKLRCAIKNDINLCLIYPKSKILLLTNKKLTTLEINELWEI